MTLILLILTSLNLWAAPDHDCHAPSEHEEVITRADFPWDQSLNEILALETKVYESNKRLPERAYKKDEKVVLTIDPIKVESWQFNFNKIQVEHKFVDTLKSQIEKIKEKNYGTALIYSDIGHVHIFASDEDIQKLHQEGLNGDHAKFYESLFQSKNTKFLYHTAEQLRSPQTPEEEFKKTHRNIVADADGNIEATSFMKNIDQHSQLFSIYFNAAKSDCFKSGKTNFDISLSSPQ